MRWSESRHIERVLFDAAFDRHIQQLWALKQLSYKQKRQFHEQWSLHETPRLWMEGK